LVTCIHGSFIQTAGVCLENTDRKGLIFDVAIIEHILKPSCNILTKKLKNWKIYGY